jgi:hypothetical protein
MKGSPWGRPLTTFFAFLIFFYKGKPKLPPKKDFQVLVLAQLFLLPGGWPQRRLRSKKGGDS